jgi:hypothetical protein
MRAQYLNSTSYSRSSMRGGDLPGAGSATQLSTPCAQQYGVDIRDPAVSTVHPHTQACFIRGCLTQSGVMRQPHSATPLEASSAGL